MRKDVRLFRLGTVTRKDSVIGKRVISCSFIWDGRFGYGGWMIQLPELSHCE
jgi:hypothetical protein